MVSAPRNGFALATGVQSVHAPGADTADRPGALLDHGDEPCAGARLAKAPE